ncbi:MAG: hypothetical protein RLY78_1900 [Pseudomonadota bacterium]
MRQALERQRQEVGQLQAQLGSAQRASTWIPVLLVGLLGTAALAIWLGLRARALHRELTAAQAGIPATTGTLTREPSTSGGGWNTASGGEQVGPGSTSAAGTIGLRAVGGARLSDERVSGFGGMSPLSGTARGLVPGVRPQPAGAPAHARDAEPTSPAVALVERGGALREAADRGDSTLITGVPPREVSVEELMDLEQQVDFFMVLGQQEAAVDLLVGHIRNTGGTSPVAYLKLLEIYSALGQAEGYERTRSRFTKRFAAQVPEWGQPLDEGRALDGHPGVLDRLQLLWPRPVEALRELERMLRLSAGTALYELPAFRELVLLHGVVTDLIGHPLVERVQDIDILLPIGEPERAATSAVPSGGVWAALRGTESPRTSRAAARREEHDATRPHVATPLPESGFGPAARLDLDLSDFGPAPRDFSESSSFTQPAAFTTHPHLFRESRAAGLSGLAPFDGDAAGAPSSRQGELSASRRPGEGPVDGAHAAASARRAAVVGAGAGVALGDLAAIDPEATLDLAMGGDLGDSASRPAPFDVDPIAPGRPSARASHDVFGSAGDSGALLPLPTLDLGDDAPLADALHAAAAGTLAPSAALSPVKADDASSAAAAVVLGDAEDPLELPDDLVLQVVGGGVARVDDPAVRPADS